MSNSLPEVVRTDSGDEQFAYLVATYGPTTTWQVTAQSWRTLSTGETIEVTTVRLATGESVDVHFGLITPESDGFDLPPVAEPANALDWLDRVMQAAVTFSEANPPHHPGTIARFPVPAAGYADALSVPMGLIAMDTQGRGLYAPPRMVALHRETLAPVGVGEFPGFDPEFWPPARLAEWPFAPLVNMPAEQLQAVIHRFSATWSRVLDAWFGTPYPFLKDDIRAALAYRDQLDVAAMATYYERMNPVFAKWLRDQTA